MFECIYKKEMAEYYGLRSAVLSESGKKHELCYLLRFDGYLRRSGVAARGMLDEKIMDRWIGTLCGKSGSIENEVIVIRKFLQYLSLSGEKAFIPAVPKVRDDYVPYLFSDDELARIFKSADSVVQHDRNADPLLPAEFPVILRLLYSCGMRIGETVRIEMQDVDLANGLLRLVNTKYGKQRLIPVSDAMAEILFRYACAMGLNGKREGWLFPSGRAEGHISDKAVKQRFETILRQNGIRLPNRKKRERGPCLHCMRHVFAFKSFAQAERQGRHLDSAIPYLSLYLGHDSLYETEKYLKFSSEMFPETVEAFGSYMSGVLPEADYEA